jgi:gas vesicle protein
MKDHIKIIAALIAALTAGAILGILFAPDEGSETRKSARNSVKGIGECIRDTTASELYRLSDLKRRIIVSIKAQLLGPELEMPDDLEHG